MPLSVKPAVSLAIALMACFISMADARDGGPIRPSNKWWFETLPPKGGTCCAEAAVLPAWCSLCPLLSAEWRVFASSCRPWKV